MERLAEEIRALLAEPQAALSRDARLRWEGAVTILEVVLGDRPSLPEPGSLSVQITLDVYSHATKGMQDDAAAFIGSLVLGPRHESRRQNADISAEVADFSASTDA
jgi:hypothetical protein